MKSRDRAGNTVETYDGQGKSIAFLYGAAVGRAVLRVLIRPAVSRFGGWVLNRRISRVGIRPFVRKNQINLSDYEGAPYRSYNDFFCRRIRPGLRPIAPEPALIAPCDGKLTVCPIDADARFQIKGVSYTMAELVRDPALASRYNGGLLWIFRLTVDDYHRYAFPADGLCTPSVHLAGVFHTVNPRAAEVSPIYRENTRSYTVIDSDRFGRVLMMEVGAMFVGRMVNPPCTRAVRGAEAGWFEFGGSTVILATEPGKAEPDGDICRNSAEKIETVVKLGERVGLTKE